MSSIKKKVRTLLKAGKKLEEIARHLHLSRNEVAKLRNQIVEDRRKWNKKSFILQPHKALILQMMTQACTIKQIHDRIRRSKIKVSYTSVSRFVNRIKRKSFQEGYCSIPAGEAIVYFISLGSFIKEKNKVKVWMFYMRLAYSQFCYHRLVTDNSIETFLQCHIKAFLALGGAPMKITKICCRGINLDHAGYLTRYNYFLYCCGSCYTPKYSKHCGVDCKEDIKVFRDRFVSTILHNDFDSLKQELDYSINTVINLSIHSITGMMIKKQFLRYEKNKLNALTRTTIKRSLI